MLFNVIIVFHVLVTFSLVLVVLLQSSKGEALGGSAFGGGGGGGSSFGSVRSTPLSKMTTILAVLFMLNCIFLTILNADSATNAGQPGAAESIVTERIQEEIAAQQAAAQNAPDSLQPLNIDSLVQVEPGSSDSF